MVGMGRWNGVLVAALALVLSGWPAALRAQDDRAQAQLKALNERADQFYERGEYRRRPISSSKLSSSPSRRLGPTTPTWPPA